MIKTCCNCGESKEIKEFVNKQIALTSFLENLSPNYNEDMTLDSNLVTIYIKEKALLKYLPLLDFKQYIYPYIPACFFGS